MRKNIFIILFSLSSCTSSLKYLDKFDGLNGKPVEVESTSFRVAYKNNIPTKKLVLKSIEFYDSKGRKTKTSIFKSDSTLSIGEIYYSYDKFGNQIKSIFYNLDSTRIVERLYKYDKYGNEIESAFISGDLKSTTKRIYDRKNKSLKIIGKDGDGNVTEDAIQKHDEKWNKTEFISYDSSGYQKNKIEFVYNRKGNEIYSKWYNSENEPFAYYNSTYNIKNDIIKIEKYRITNGQPTLIDDTKITHIYDKEGNCIEEKLIHNSKTTRITINKYKYNWE